MSESTYATGYRDGMGATQAAADVLAAKLEAEKARANEAWRQVQDARADLAEQRKINRDLQAELKACMRRLPR